MAKIVCANKKLKQREDHHFDLCRSDLDAGCSDCYFMECHQGGHYSEDWAHCTVGLKVKFGDKIKVTPAVARKVKLVGEKSPDYDI